MNNEANETIADIVAEMRDESHAGDASFLEWVGAKMRSYADRIEAAEKRENEKIGNAAEMREALEKVMFYLPHFLQYMRLHWEDAEAGGFYETILEVVNAALSAPPRNCDVGTPKEQSARFDAHCRKHMGCLTCPLREKDGSVPKHCEFAWAQIPYEEVK